MAQDSGVIRNELLSGWSQDDTQRAALISKLRDLTLSSDISVRDARANIELLFRIDYMQSAHAHKMTIGNSQVEVVTYEPHALLEALAE